MQQTRKTELWV
ncbi:putative phospholipid ABC transporter-binding protein mlaD, partial [Vibrio parahaemolyticus VPTS-2010_2]